MGISDAEFYFWLVCGIIAAIVMLAVYLPWNDKYDPKGDDPYRYCPKDEESQ